VVTLRLMLYGRIITRAIYYLRYKDLIYNQKGAA